MDSGFSNIQHPAPPLLLLDWPSLLLRASLGRRGGSRDWLRNRGMQRRVSLGWYERSTKRRSRAQKGNGAN